MNDGKIRILIADDQRLFADNLKTVLETRTEDMTVTGIAGTGEEAIRLAKSQWPDVILMDVCMPLLDGVRAIREIRRDAPRAKILVLTTFGDDDYVLEALKFGAAGYLLKDISMAELIQTIRNVNAGAIMISPEVANNMVRHLSERKTSAETKGPAEPPEWLARLSKRERQIFRLIGEGRNNYDIGSTLSIGEQTVKNYVSAIYEKSGVHDRFAIMKEAERLSEHTGE